MGCDWNTNDMPNDNGMGFNYLYTPPTQNTLPNFNTTDETLFNFAQHGTKVTSLICAKTNNNYGIAGVAGGWNGNEGAKPIEYVVGEFGDIYTACVKEAIGQACLDDVRILNMSFSGGFLPDDMKKAIIYAHDYKDIIMIASAGSFLQGQSSSVRYPAKADYVIAVGGTQMRNVQLNEWDEDEGGYRYFWDEERWTKIEIASCFGEGLDLMAATPNILLSGYQPALGSQNTNIMNETEVSYSTALVSGIAGLLLSVNPCLTSEQVENILKNSCDKIGIGPFTYDLNGWCFSMGYGRVNPKKALKIALGLLPTTITGNETWNTKKFSGNIIIEPNATLTLNNMILEMADNKGIEIKAGGKLIVNHAVITSLCAQKSRHWRGITVQGNYAMANAIPNQGYLHIYNNSLIENANTAIAIPFNDDVNPYIGGGMVQASNSSFRNNEHALDFGEYTKRSTSFFDNCSFTFEQDYPFAIDTKQPLINLWGNFGLKFTGCKFANYKTVNTGVGIQTIASSFSTSGGCTSNQISPCPANMLIYNTFENLNYGIYSMISNMNAKTSVQKAKFVNNIYGAYFSNYFNSELLDCDFNVPEQNSGVCKYGAYYNQSSGYHIEGNRFWSDAPNNTGNTGLWLTHSGTNQNFVYRNTFFNLSRAAVSLGKNRSSGGSTGLCFKCNDFSHNGTDIDVVLPDNTLATQYDGIAKEQGSASKSSLSLDLDSLAASNTFSDVLEDHNLRNKVGSENFSNYYYQENNFTIYKIIPNDDLNITKVINQFTKYDRPNLCKPWRYNNNIVQIKAQKDAATANAEALQQQLLFAVDRGSTSDLTFDVLGTTPANALDLRNNLIEISPFLSDTVMKTAIDQETVLPNAMIRDILVQNPQAAKSNEIMDRLDERWEPMPDNMKEEIAAGRNIIGGRELMEAQRDGWKQQEGLLFDRIVSAYLDDTLNPNANSDLQLFLQNDNSARASLLLANQQIQKHEYVQASQTITAMQANINLTELETKQADDYLTLVNILQELQTAHISPLRMDSLHYGPMFAMYESGSTQACALARDFLIASHLLIYNEPFDHDTTLKSGAVTRYVNPITKKEMVDEIMQMFPNPAFGYTIVDYSLPSGIYKAILSIVSSNGTVVKQMELSRTKDQLVLDLQGISSGSYSVVLQNGKKVLANHSLKVIK